MYNKWIFMLLGCNCINKLIITVIIIILLFPHWPFFMFYFILFYLHIQYYILPICGVLLSVAIFGILLSATRPNHQLNLWNYHLAQMTAQNLLLSLPPSLPSMGKTTLPLSPSLSAISSNSA